MQVPIVRKTRSKPQVIPVKPVAVPWPRSYFLILGALFLATFAVYASVAHFDFVNFDDPDYVTNNPHVRNGITPDGLEWALTSGEVANWFPLTRISHILDCEIFGLRAGWHHLTNVLIHALAALLLFAFLHRATHALWRSAFVAFLFALHPLHVESVAWVAERKDVLSAFFWFLSLWAYVRYVENPAPRRYLLVLGAFCLGLMSKPMIVTLPFVLLLLDLWPLNRGLRLREKTPFFALSAASAIVTFAVQRGSGAVQAVAALPIGLRVENAAISCIVYIAKMLWPSGLAVFYPYPPDWPVWQAALATVAVAAVSLLALRRLRTNPYLAAGWFWYLITLLPVIGLIQVGAQARADRYMYVPMVGLSIMLAWGAADLLRNRRFLIALGAAACAASATVTWAQVQYWRNSETLFQHTLDVTSRNYLAEHNLGVALMDVPGRLPEALTHLETAVRLQPNSAKALTDLGTALSKTPGRLAEAVAAYQAALRIDPDSPIPRANLAITLSKLGQLPEAANQLQAAVRAEPDSAEAHHALGVSVAAIPGREADAIAEYETALRLKPNYADAHSNLATVLAGMPNRLSEAIAHYETAARLDPDSAQVQYNLGVALARVDGRLPEAIAHLEAALRRKPDYAEAHNNLGVALSNIPSRLPDAISHFEAALRINPAYEDARYNLSLAKNQLAADKRR